MWNVMLSHSDPYTQVPCMNPETSSTSLLTVKMKYILSR